jgi:carbamate kinase
LISTSVEQVALGYATPGPRPLDHVSLADARRYLAAGEFPPGSMGPKIEAAIGYLERGGRLVIITSPERIPEALHGMAGTRITANADAARARVNRVA